MHRRDTAAGGARRGRLNGPPGADLRRASRPSDAVFEDEAADSRSSGGCAARGAGRIRVLLVDDHAVVRAGFRRLLHDTADIQVVAEAADGRQSCQCYLETRPDVVVMDLSLPEMSGLEAIRRILARDPLARVLVFSMHEEAVFAERALEAGAVGYITKSSAPEVLVEGVGQVARGKVYLGPDVAQRIAVKRVTGKGGGALDRLTPREFEIFRLLAEGRGVAEIAERLCLGYKTVANYSTQIKGKLGASSTAELARLAIRHRVIQA
jgi:two-component system, NarL family, invasion response regulator UvrY